MMVPWALVLLAISTITEASYENFLVNNRLPKCENPNNPYVTVEDTDLLTLGLGTNQDSDFRILFRLDTGTLFQLIKGINCSGLEIVNYLLEAESLGLV